MLPRKYTKALIFLTLLLAGCGKITTSIQDRPDLTQDGARVPHLIWSASARLESVDESMGENIGGFMEVNVYDNNTAVPAFRLHLPKAAGGHYEAWLARNYPADAINFGPLIRSENGGYRLGNTTIIIDKDFGRYDTVLITRKSAGENEPTSLHPLLRGTLKVVSGL